MTRSISKKPGAFLVLFCLATFVRSTSSGSDASLSFAQDHPRERPTDGRELAFDMPSNPQEVEAALDRRLEKLNFQNSPLQQCVQWIGKRIGVPILLSREELEDVGVTPNQPVTLRFRYAAVKARRVLELVLHPLGLDYVIEDGVIWVTTPPCESLEVRAYGCGDLLGDDVEKLPPDVRKSRLVALIRLIRDHTSEPWEEVDGIGGWVACLDSVLIIAQSRRAHREIAELLGQIRNAKAARREPSRPLPASCE